MCKFSQWRVRHEITEVIKNMRQYSIVMPYSTIRRKIIIYNIILYNIIILYRNKFILENVGRHDISQLIS